ncbi:large ribosomal subunit protein uL2x-like [Miscanthus floridulus]|uniref:large ribosomal subunit protein uL2x-like n=1 Tax=Miscanthus floridulus TaxID=154761 RepID=UPI00345AA3A4
MYTGQFIYYDCRATLSIGDVPPLCGVLEGTITYNDELHIGNCSASAGATWDYAIVISRNPDNGVRVGNASRQRRDTANDSNVDDVRRPPVLLPLRQQRLLNKGGSHHLIYIG